MSTVSNDSKSAFSYMKQISGLKYAILRFAGLQLFPYRHQLSFASKPQTCGTTVRTSQSCKQLQSSKYTL
jgi:hypothetical protein